MAHSDIYSINGDDLIKYMCNGIALCGVGPGSKILALDGVDGLTSHAAAEKGVYPYDIDIPNFTPETVEGLRSYRLSTVYEMGADKFVEGTQRQYDAVYMDFCSSLPKNLRCIQQIFRRQLIEDGGRLSMTISLNSFKGKGVFAPDRYEEQITKALRKAAAAGGYELIISQDDNFGYGNAPEDFRGKHDLPTDGRIIDYVNKRSMYFFSAEVRLIVVDDVETDVSTDDDSEMELC
jgi:hypothetical protein